MAPWPGVVWCVGFNTLTSLAGSVGKYSTLTSSSEWFRGRSVNLDEAQGVRVNLTVPAPNTVMDFDFIGVRSSDDDITLAQLTLPSPLLVPPNLSAGLSTHICRLFNTKVGI